MEGVLCSSVVASALSSTASPGPGPQGTCSPCHPPSGYTHSLTPPPSSLGPTRSLPIAPHTPPSNQPPFATIYHHHHHFHHHQIDNCINPSSQHVPYLGNFAQPNVNKPEKESYTPVSPPPSPNRKSLASCSPVHLFLFLSPLP